MKSEMLVYGTVNILAAFFVSARYLRQGGYVIVVVCLSGICLVATLRKNFQIDVHEIFTEGRQWANEQMVKFWWRSGSQIRISRYW